MSSSFRDHFSKQAEQYSRHRPVYPGELFDYLAGLAPGRVLAWDCGTGNGQAAIELAKRFDRVIATDASAEQIKNAFAASGVEYRCEPAEATSIPSGSVDLVTVGTAVHWFEFDPFYAEVRRVSKPGGILAVWTYHLPRIESGVDEWLENFFRRTLAGAWPERIAYLDERYRTLPFPFEEIRPRPISMTSRWDFACFVGFLASWSGTRHFCESNGEKAFERVIASAAPLWGKPGLQRVITWDLYFRIGKVFPVGKNS
jgi:SAM-dependent methyltransferase